jgi:hypothetical protein
VIALAALLLVLQAVAAPPAASQTPAAPRVQMGVAVRPDTITVGQHFVVMVRVRAPRGSEISFPPGPDSGLSVEAVDPRDIERSSDTTAVERTAIYRLVAWDTGGQTTHLGALVVTTDGVDRRIAIGGDSIYVRSVLPADTAQQTPKAARDILIAGRPWWHWLLAAIVALALVSLFIWWWRRRHGRRARAAPTDAFEDAEREFARIDALGLLEAGERGRYVALNIEVLRDYLAVRLVEARRSLTSTELLDALRLRREVPSERLAPMLAESDLIKFARRPVSTEHARELGHEARAVVTAVEQAILADQAAKAEERAA